MNLAAVKKDKRVETVEHDEDGWWIYLNDDYADKMTDPLQASHIIHEDTLSECVSILKTVEKI